MFLYKLEHVATRAAGKALVNAEARVYVHRWAAVVMEGADAQEAPVTRTFQRYKILDDRCDVRMGLELLNDLV